MKPKNLKLIARKEEDLRVVSAHLQDSIVSVSDIANLKKNKIFLMQLNRFMWEDVEKGVFRKNKRIRTILKFENVLKILSKMLTKIFHKLAKEASRACLEALEDLPKSQLRERTSQRPCTMYIYIYIHT